MVSNKKEALELCKVYGVDISVHPNTVVTEAGNVYLNDSNIDPKDNGQRFYVSQDDELTEEVKPKKPKK
jgi:hypothetical protein